MWRWRSANSPGSPCCSVADIGAAAASPRKLLVLLWCLPPLAMASAVTIFHLRKHAVLQADGPRARELGRHFIVGYSSFDEIAALAAKGLIGGIYVTRHNIGGRSADALRSEIARLQTIRRDAGLPPLIVAADQEGGIVSHLSPPLTSLPALATLAALPPAERSSEGRSVWPHPRPRTGVARDHLEFRAGGRSASNRGVQSARLQQPDQPPRDCGRSAGCERYRGGLCAGPGSLRRRSHREAFSRVRARPGRHPSLSRRSRPRRLPNSRLRTGCRSARS